MRDESHQYPSAEVRRRAVLASGVAPEAILRAMADPAWVVREAAAVAAGRWPDLHADLVALALTDPVALVRTAAARSAGPLIDPERDFAGAARHAFERQRVRAMIALGHTSPTHVRAALTILAAGLADAHPKVRRAALVGLAVVPPDSAVELLPDVIRRACEAEPAVRDTALSLCEPLFACRGADGVRPLRPFVGVAQSTAVSLISEVIATSDPLRRAWETIGEPRPALPVLLQRLCRFVLDSRAP